MVRPALLDEAAITTELRTVPAWLREGAAIRRKLRFADFRAAFAFMTRVAAASERLDHHPDWQNSYRDVEIALTTHDQGGLTRLDFELARAIDAAARA